MSQIKVQRIQVSLTVEVSMSKEEKDKLKTKIRSLVKEVTKREDVEVYTTYEEKEENI